MGIHQQKGINFQQLGNFAQQNMIGGWGSNLSKLVLVIELTFKWMMGIWHLELILDYILYLGIDSHNCHTWEKLSGCLNFGVSKLPKRATC